MPEWLLSFCVHICILFGTTVSIIGFGFLFVLGAVEIYDFFTEDLDDDDEEDYRY